MTDFSPFFDQERPQCEVIGMIASADHSPPYELDAMAVFQARDGFLVVAVSGCSCWPDMGGTVQTVCRTRAEVDQAVPSNYHDLIEACQTAKWESRAERSDPMKKSEVIADDAAVDRIAKAFQSAADELARIQRVPRTGFVTIAHLQMAEEWDDRLCCLIWAAENGATPAEMAAWHRVRATP